MPSVFSTESKYFLDIPSEHHHTPSQDDQADDGRWQLSPIQPVAPRVVVPYFVGFFALFFALTVLQNCLRWRNEARVREELLRDRFGRQRV